MKPMGINSTRFLKYHEIIIDYADLLDDAMSLKKDFHDVFEFLDQVSISTGKRLTSRLLKNVRNETGKF
jgi:hypothetical protein